MKPPRTVSRPCLLMPLLLLYHLAAPLAAATDADALLALKSALDTSHRLPWSAATAAALCTAWPGVRQCDASGRVTKLVLENLNLTGTLAAPLLAPLRELRVLSFKSNALSGTIPDNLAAALPNLKLLYLSGNRLQGLVPATLARLRRATVLVLSDNDLSGGIPRELASGVPRLTALMLDGNRLTGPVPALPQPTLRRLDVSGNRLEGQIPAVLVGKAGACGAPTDASFVEAAPSAEAPLFPGRAAFVPLPLPGSRSGGTGPTGGSGDGCWRGRNKRLTGEVDKGASGTHTITSSTQPKLHHQGRTRRRWAADGSSRGIGKLVFRGHGKLVEMLAATMPGAFRISG